MPNQEKCKKALLQSFEDGCGGRPVQATAKAWLDGFCTDWIAAPPNAEGRTVSELWDEEHKGKKNGPQFEGRFKKIGETAAKKCKNGEVTEADVEAATQEVTQASTCPFCPDV